MVNGRSLTKGGKGRVLCWLLFLVLFTIVHCTVFAGTGTNPGSGGGLDYAGGDWDGSVDDDDLTNEFGATVSGSIYGNEGDDSLLNEGTVDDDIFGDAGGDTIGNSGTVRSIFGGEGNDDIDNIGTVTNEIVGSSDDPGENSIENAGNGSAQMLIGTANEANGSTTSGNTIVNTDNATVSMDIYGTWNGADDTTGGANTITNEATVGGDIVGTYNDGTRASGDGAIINNSGNLTGAGSSIIGTWNTGASASGGSNTISNTGGTDYILGSANEGDDAFGGSNEITNSGAGVVEGDIYGSNNIGDRSSGGSNEITNSATVDMDILGSYNQGQDSSGGSNTITNSGSVDNILGTANDWDGASGGSNTITNEAAGNVASDIFGTNNLEDGNSGGFNTITNEGTVGGIITGSANQGNDSHGGSNEITNSGSVTNAISGSHNVGDNSYGSSNSISNSGTVTGDIVGSWNLSDDASGGSNTILNTDTGQVDNLVGSGNNADGTSGGSNDITNHGAVTNDIYGSYNFGDDGAVNTNGGDNTILNTGDVDGDIFGSNNLGDNSYGGGNTITNEGTVGGSVYGSENQGTGSSSTGNTISNSGTITGTIHGGGGDDEITNSGIVGGDISGGSGNDTVIIQSGSSVSGTVDGGSGNDLITLENAGTQDAGTFTNFEDLSISGTEATTLTGTWNYTGSEISTDGTLNVFGSLNVASLTTNSGGTTNITGSATITGATGISGTLDVSGSLDSSTMDINSGGTVDISGSATVSGATDVTGTLSVSSGGTLGSDSLTIDSEGDVDIADGGTATISGATTASGTLHVDGTLATSRLTINRTGSLTGTGSINGDLIHQGTIAPGNSVGVLAVDGDYTVASGSTLEIEIEEQDASDLVTATGTAIINGGTMDVDLSRDLYTRGSAWTVISADEGVTGAFDEITGAPDSLILTMVVVSYDNEVVVELSRKNFEEFGLTAGARAAGAGLDALINQSSLNNDDMADLITTMDWDYSRAQIQNTLASLSPEFYLAFPGAAWESDITFDLAMRQRTNHLRIKGDLIPDLETAGPDPMLAMASNHIDPGMLAGQESKKGWTAWARGLARKSDYKASGDYIGYDLITGGLIIGVDGPVLPWLWLGIAAANTRTDPGWDQTGYTGSQDGYHGGVYAKAVFGGLHLDGALAYGMHRTDAERSFAVDGDSYTAKADFDATTWLVRLGGAYDFKLGNWLLGPAAYVNWQGLDQDGFFESGADYLNLSVTAETDNSIISSLGGRVAGFYPIGGVVLLPRASLAWLHNFNDTYPGFSATYRDYAESPFTLSGASRDQDILAVDMGLALRMNKKISVALDYNLNSSTSYISHTAALTMDWYF